MLIDWTLRKNVGDHWLDIDNIDHMIINWTLRTLPIINWIGQINRQCVQAQLIQAEHRGGKPTLLTPITII